MKLQESFVYFKIFKPTSWGNRPAERRCRLIQRFLKYRQQNSNDTGGFDYGNHHDFQQYAERTRAGA